MKINISVVIPSLNGANHFKDFLIKNLELMQVAKDKYEDFNNLEIVVSNDNSTDDTLEYLAECKKKYKHLVYGTNPKQGICSARNYGVEISSLKNFDDSYLNYILNLDNDVLLDENFFRNIIKYLKTSPFCVTCDGVSYFTKEKQDGVKLLDFKRGFLRLTKNIYKDAFNAPFPIDIPSFGAQGAYFLLRYEDFLEIGGFDENLDPYMLDDSDIVYRGLKRGKKCIYAPDATGYHKVGGTIQSKVSKKTKLLSKRNRNYFMWKNVHNKKLRAIHFFFLGFSILTPIGFEAFLMSLKMYPKALELNKKEKNHIKVDDKVLINLSRSFKKNKIK